MALKAYQHETADYGLAKALGEPDYTVQVRVLVRARSWAEAQRMFAAAGIRASLHTMKAYGGITGNAVDLELLDRVGPGTVIARPLTDHRARWVVVRA